MSQTKTPFGVIDRASIQSLQKSGNRFQLWNVLTTQYYKADKNLPGSRWVPLDGITAESAAKLAAKDETIVVYCGGPQCPQSRQAAEKLASLGYEKVFAYEGGIQDWVEAGLPVVRL